MISIKKSLRYLSILALPYVLASCGSGSQDSGASGSCTTTNFTPTSLPVVGTAGTNPNVMNVTVNGSLCTDPADNYPNEPCVSVTICSSSTPSSCQTINNILLDTGSFGLRVFASALNVSLAPVTSSSQYLGECAEFGDGSSEWGPVEYAYVQMGNEPKVSMPILVIDPNFQNPPGPCTSSESNPDTSPQQAGFNGILGVGLFAQDCGAECANDPNNGQYYSCSGGDCSCGATVALGAQVQNPVALQPTDNNGVILELGSVSTSTGANYANGNLYLGIGTRSNNIAPSSGITTYTANLDGNFGTIFSAFSSIPMPGFLDSGSNAYYFPAPTGGQLPDCGVAYGPDFEGEYCPTSVQTFNATNIGASGSSSVSVPFSIGNAYSFLYPFVNSSSGAVPSAFSSLGISSGYATQQAVTFDWGLPFFFGKNIYVGIESASATIGGANVTGPYWAY